LRRSIAGERCRRDQRPETSQHSCGQDLIEIFDRQPSNAGIRRADTIDGRVQRLTRDDRREQGKDVLEMAGAHHVGRFGFRRLVNVGKIEQAIALPDLGCHRELALHDRDHVGAIDRELGIFRHDSIDRATAVVTNFESCIVESAHQSVQAPRGGDRSENSRDAAPDSEIGRRLDQHVDKQPEMRRRDRLECFADRRHDVVPCQEVHDLSDMYP